MPTFYAIGNTIVDIFIKTSKLPKNLQIDVPTFFTSEQLDILINEVTLNGRLPVHRSTGGVASNIIKTTALLGSKSFFSSSIAHDDNGHFFEETMKSYGVCPFLDYTKQATGRFVTFVGPKDENGKYICAPTYTFSEDDKITTALLRYPYLVNSDLVIMESLTIMNTELWNSVLTTCEEYNKTILLALIGPPNIIDHLAQTIIDYNNKLPMIILSNKKEAERLKEYLNKKGYDYSKLLNTKDKSKSPIIFEFKEKDGISVWFEDKYIHEKNDKQNILDYTGSSEIFIGSFITRWFSISKYLHDNRKTLNCMIECIKFANTNLLNSLEKFGSNF